MAPITQRDCDLLLGPEEIREQVRAIGEEIGREYAERDPILVCVLQGGFVFFADLIREIPVPFQVDFVQAASYGSETVSSGVVEILQELRTDVRDRHVIIVEDIVDTGRTARALVDAVRRGRPASVALCTLLDKKARREVEVEIRWTGFVVPDRFVVGYGIDVGGRCRGWRGVWAIPDEMTTGTDR